MTMTMTMASGAVAAPTADARHGCGAQHTSAPHGLSSHTSTQRGAAAAAAAAPAPVPVEAERARMLALYQVATAVDIATPLTDRFGQLPPVPVWQWAGQLVMNAPCCTGTWASSETISLPYATQNCSSVALAHLPTLQSRPRIAFSCH